ncbi:MAG: serine hydrolase domain-containing protein [Pseudomonadota bacterium]
MGLLLAFPAAFSLGAEGSAPGAAQQDARQKPPPSTADFGSLVDRILHDQLAFYGIPGAAVAVVEGGRLVHLGGYGLADLELRRPVSADTTLFRVGSVSKLITWTAVMQLVEQNRLDLDADVNRYLTAVQIPATYPEPVTLAHLLTHTAGLEDRAFGFYARSTADLVPLGAFLASHMPARIFPPGEVSAYSNYGAALAGYIVEQVSGIPFEDYVEMHILDPLGMAGSSFRQPLPTPLAARLATGYRASLEPGDFELDLAVPAGALSATAEDMARFMIAHLQEGRIGTARILREATAETMQQRQFANHPAVSGLTYGFQELNIAGQRILAQPGDMQTFTSALFLLPEHDLGIHVAYNRGRASEVPMELLRAFLSRFLPSSPWEQTTPQPVPDSDINRFAGSYRSTRRQETGLEKLQEFFNPVRVRVAGPDALHISGLSVVPESQWIQTTRGVFRDRRSPEILAFREDAAGRATHLFEDNFPSAGYTRLPWFGAPDFHYALLGVCALLFLVTPLAWLVMGLRRPARSGVLLAPRARWVAGTLCGVNLFFLVGMSVVIANGRELLFGITPLARAVLFLPLVSTVLTGLALFCAVLIWGRGVWTFWNRLHYALVSLSGLVFLALLHYWNLLVPGI